MAEHDARSLFAAAEPGEEREGREDIYQTQGIVHQQCAAIVLGDLRAVGGYQVGKNAEKGDGGVIGDDLDHLQHHAGEILQEAAHRSIPASV